MFSIWGYIVVGVIAGLFLALFMLLFLLSFSPAIASLIDQVVVSFLKDVVGPVSAGFGGAIAGAYAAFYLQKKSQTDKDFQESARALSLAKLHYIQMLNDLISIKKESFLPHRDHRVRFTLIAYLPDKPLTGQILDTKLLDMLLAQKASKVISNVLLASKRYGACFENFKGRNGTIDEYRAIVNAAPLGQGFTTDFLEICKVVEPGRMMALFRNTEDLIIFLDDTIEFLVKTIQEIGQALDQQFKSRGVSVIDLQPISPSVLERMPGPYFTKERLEAVLRAARSDTP